MIRRGLEPGISGSQGKRPNHWATCLHVEIQDLHQKKHSCFERVLVKLDDQGAKAAYKNVSSTVQNKLREMKNKWWIALAEQTQLYTDTGNTCAFYEALHAVYGHMQQVQAPLRSSDGNRLLTDKESILHCWTERYENLFGDKRHYQHYQHRGHASDQTATVGRPPVSHGAAIQLIFSSGELCRPFDGSPRRRASSGPLAHTFICRDGKPSLSGY